jgi:hypothetical protein
MNPDTGLNCNQDLNNRKDQVIDLSCREFSSSQGRDPGHSHSHRPSLLQGRSRSPRLSLLQGHSNNPRLSLRQNRSSSRPNLTVAKNLTTKRMTGTRKRLTLSRDTKEKLQVLTSQNRLKKGAPGSAPFFNAIPTISATELLPLDGKSVGLLFVRGKNNGDQCKDAEKATHKQPTDRLGSGISFFH